MRRVLRPDGAMWLNIGDTWFGGRRGGSRGTNAIMRKYREESSKARALHTRQISADGLKRKDMVLLPARVSIALQDAGWWVRSEVIWHKPNPMPESAKDRPTHAHEHIYLMTKGPKYYWDGEGIREPVSGNAHARGKAGGAASTPRIFRWENYGNG